jgi:hypothetical protein
VAFCKASVDFSRRVLWLDWSYRILADCAHREQQNNYDYDPHQNLSIKSGTGASRIAAKLPGGICLY